MYNYKWVQIKYYHDRKCHVWQIEVGMAHFLGPMLVSLFRKD